MSPADGTLIERLNAASDTCKLRVGTYRGLCSEAANRITQAELQLSNQALAISDLHAEIARLRARPTEEELARKVRNVMLTWKAEGETTDPAIDIARAVIALFSKVQPMTEHCLCPDYELRGQIYEIHTDSMHPSNRCLVDPRTRDIVDTDHAFDPPLSNDELLGIYGLWERLLKP